MLPFRDGLAPLRLLLPHGDSAITIVEYLERELPEDDWRRAVLDAEVVDEKSRPISIDTRYRAGSQVYFYRVPAQEVPVPFEIGILHEDDDLLVVDKPHFLATIPRGRHVTETATVRLRKQFDCPDLTPAHRLDRATAGVLLFTKTKHARRPYQELFSSRNVTKEYEAVAGFDAALEFPRIVRSRILKKHGVMTAYEEPGEPNSETLIELIDQIGTVARYRLFPKTGKTHQLRIHLSSLGIPIVNDPYYPVFTSVPAEDFTRPLQLLARALNFTDPLTGEPRRFVSARTLEL
ncbi:pseudouridine synthase [Rhodococcus cercidiphylli]|uniref:RNA pseudouridylate synthase n=1 Tax=Rhodococcus cercidiphylli TaxID=489916 RepID=A0ABU4AZ31_9NOCA|nr:pseudouridine synthase [Rhodococcus cercidiphylli]MDV6231502.1 pseudouridine synthase [Rhodococcus cercidiphylli]